ncbi:alkaline phosphatase [Dasania sp. GY-MA-18]|uniref:Alkaline phosphatase n=1 Tax=Dasania phycosphaerae TaxID=2950436 RepID=A0A9J6RJW9_9GAMM|nr:MULTISPECIES: alkaline phosphatase [Dasania]MCR8922280.1 alkaline phosphatase [Dasania sp. GY-MA-18]MCZ0864708.1 alkaline phosphatase [Dasania phycosphaerae]MCZ0868436.1 alkaline phosphatase [Dasania phycosphaerae]
MLKLIAASAAALCLNATAAQTASPWYQQGQAALQQAMQQQPNTGQAKNIILFVGDGMGVSTVTAARIYQGQQQGLAGEEHRLFFETLPYTALSKTYNSNQQTADSAGTMSAMMTGVKTKAGFIAVSEQPRRGDCAASLKHQQATFLEQAEQAGMATGVVSSARITHATPAATYAHSPERDWESDSDMPAQAKQQGCLDIAAQLLTFQQGDGIEVVLGGGRRNFLPAGANGVRADGRNLIQEWQAKYPQGLYVSNQQQLQAVDASDGQPLLGLFSASHLPYALNRTADSTEPRLIDMTSKAIDLLSQHQQGYFLMVEGGRIDHGHHGNSAKKALTETLEFAAAIEQAYRMTNPAETLIIVTADHSHVFTMAGYPTRGNPILGKVIVNDDWGNPMAEPDLALDGKPYTTLAYANGEVAMSPATEQQPAKILPRQDLSAVDTAADDYKQQALVPLYYGESHGGEDVAIYASGPWAHLFRGVQEQHYIYHVMRHAAQLNARNKQPSDSLSSD